MAMSPLSVDLIKNSFLPFLKECAAAQAKGKAKKLLIL